MSIAALVSEPPQTAAELHVYRVSPALLEYIWPQVEPLLAKGVRREQGRFTLRDVFRWVKSGEQQLWVVTQNGRYLAAGLFRLEIHPTGKRSSTVHLAGGREMRQWARPAFERWRELCRLEGVTEMSVVGRRGWQRVMAPYGFKPDAIILRREEI